MASDKRKPALIGNVLGELFENMMGTNWEQTIYVNVKFNLNEYT
jgi:hypothetical protein